MKKIGAVTFLAAVLLLTGCGSDLPTWNKDDLDPTTSGNLEIAIRTFLDKPDVESFAVDVAAAEVMRRPWDYYGQAVRFRGQVAVIQDYPPGHNMSEALGGESCEIVITAEDGLTIIDGLLLGNTRGLHVGDYVTFCGYPCGIMEVPNKFGGKFSHLIVVGRR